MLSLFVILSANASPFASAEVTGQIEVARADEEVVSVREVVHAQKPRVAEVSREQSRQPCADVDFEGVRQKASYITPVPGGVGPMTVTMLLVNTITSAERSAGYNATPDIDEAE